MSADDCKCFTRSGNSRRTRNGTHSFQVILPLLSSLFPHFFLLIFCLVLYQSGRGVMLTQDLSSLPALSLLTSESLSLPPLSPGSRHSSPRGGGQQIALLQVFAPRSLAFSLPMLVTMCKSCPANRSLAFHVLHGGMGGNRSA